MDASPTELVKLCRLASMAECGDHFWEGVPALGVWAVFWMSVKGRWGSWRRTAGGDLRSGLADNVRSGG
jgi:hypothetical protein